MPLLMRLKEEVERLRKENDILRGIMAKSDLPCLYCGLAKDDMAKCQHGFPGCGRADDLMCDPNAEIPVAISERLR